MRTPSSDELPPPPRRTPEGYEYLYELLLNNAIVGICFVRERRLLWTNSRMTEMFGYPEGGMDGQDIRILYATDEDYQAVGRLYPTIARNRKYTHERQMVRSNGEIFWCMIAGRMIEPKDPLSPSVWVLQDISDRRRAEEQLRRSNQRLEQTVEKRTRSLEASNRALRRQVEQRRAAEELAWESREKYRALFRHLPLGLLVTNTHGEIIEINRTLQTFLGARSKKETLDLLASPDNLLEGEGHRSLAELIGGFSSLQSAEISTLEVAWLKRGKRRAFTVIVAPMKGKSLGVSFTFRDVTEQRHAQEREHRQQQALAHASRLSLMGQMASTLAHELGQPLNACQSYIAGLGLRLRDAPASQAEVLYAVDKIRQQIDHAVGILRNVRSFVSRQPKSFSALDMAKLTANTLELVEPRCRRASVSPSLQVEHRLPKASGNPVEIQQVLVNLLLNALDAMEPIPVAQRRLEIRLARERNAMLAITVSDSGPGIAPEGADNIFEAYFTTKPDGLGMGLMICRTIVESHGGAIRSVPSPLGGAAFRFTLRAAR